MKNKYLIFIALLQMLRLQPACTSTYFTLSSPPEESDCLKGFSFKQTKNLCNAIINNNSRNAKKALSKKAYPDGYICEMINHYCICGFIGTCDGNSNAESFLEFAATRRYWKIMSTIIKHNANVQDISCKGSILTVVLKTVASKQIQDENPKINKIIAVINALIDHGANLLLAKEINSLPLNIWTKIEKGVITTPELNEMIKKEYLKIIVTEISKKIGGSSLLYDIFKKIRDGDITTTDELMQIYKEQSLITFESDTRELINTNELINTSNKIFLKHKKEIMNNTKSNLNQALNGTPNSIIRTLLCAGANLFPHEYDNFKLESHGKMSPRIFLIEVAHAMHNQINKTERDPIDDLMRTIYAEQKKEESSDEKKEAIEKQEAILLLLKKHFDITNINSKAQLKKATQQVFQPKNPIFDQMYNDYLQQLTQRGNGEQRPIEIQRPIKKTSANKCCIIT